eukprot:GHVR01140385.1.p1 GENE.GHVR01140385.1~~GHVR01140385.1.p1  ORF type:complete len:173 (-),score=57.92 GHVR01140385.1:218-703(-)
MAYLTQGSMCNAQTYTTPHHDRIQKLSQRLSGLQVGLETEKNTRLECLQSRLLDVDDRLTNSQDVSAKRFAMLKEQLSRYQVELEEERAAREKLAEDRQRDVAVLDQKSVPCVCVCVCVCVCSLCLCIYYIYLWNYIYICFMCVCVCVCVCVSLYTLVCLC